MSTPTETPSPSSSTQASTSEAALSALTVRSLRQLAGELAVRGRWRMRRAELVEAILARQATGAGLASLASRDLPSVSPVGPSVAEIPAELAPSKPPEGLNELVRFSEAPRATGASESFSVPLPQPDPDATPADAAHADGSQEPRGPREVYIDRGPPLPLHYPRPRAAVMVQSPSVAHVYWEQLAPGPGCWTVEGLDARGRVLNAFRTHDGQRGGFLHLDTGSLVEVRIRHDSGAEPLMLRMQAPGALSAGAAARGGRPLHAGGQGSTWVRPGSHGLRPGDPIDLRQGRSLAQPAGPLPHSPVRRPLAG